MKLIKPSYKIITPINGDEILKTLEAVARTCYKSEDKIESDSAPKLIKNIISRGHEAMIEFYDVIVKFTCDRGVSHEIVRHRIASYAQESTRYCNYNKDKFNNQVTFIIPSWLNIEEGYWNAEKLSKITNKTHSGEASWIMLMLEVESVYNELISKGWKAEMARSVLSNSLKTEINVKMNLREWRHFFNLRCSLAAHPQMRELTIPLLSEFKNKIPIIFDNIN